MIEAAIFDMDGLFIDSEPFWRRAEMTVFSTVGINLSEANCRETMGFRLNEVVDLWYSRFPWTGKSKKQIEFEILDSVKELIQSEGEPLPGIYDTIELCKKLNLKTAVASSSAMVLIEATVDRLGIRNEFDTLQSAENEEFGKPHPSVFIKTAQRLGVRPENCIVFEDSFHGMVAGLAAKMKVIAVPEESSDRFLAAHSILNFLDSKRVKTFIENN